MSRRPIGAQRTKVSELQKWEPDPDVGRLGFEVLMNDVRRALDDDDPALLLNLADRIVWMATHRAPLDGGPPMLPHHGIKNLALEDRAESQALLGAMSILYPDELDRGLASAAFGYCEHELPEWVAGLATLRVASAYLCDDPLGTCEVVGAAMSADSCELEVFVDVGTDPVVVHDVAVRTVRPGGSALLRDGARCRLVDFGEIAPTIERAVRTADDDGHGPQGALPIAEWLLRAAPAA